MVMQQQGGGGGKCFPAVWGVAAKPCDSCKSAAAILFCRVHSAFLCLGCDSKIHGLGHSRHERVWMCEVCEQAPATVTCKADAAALCVTCDRDIHSANPLARRHERIPVVPFYNTAESVVKSTAASALILPGGDDEDNKCSVTTTTTTTSVVEPETTPASWVIRNPTPKLVTPEIKSMEMLFSDSDPFLDFDYPISIHNSGTDSVVPVQQQQPIKSLQPMMNQSSENYLDFGFHCSKLNSFNNDDNNNNYTDQSLSQSISSSSVDVGVVPDGSSMSEISYPFGRVNNNCVDLGGSMNSGTGQGTRDREARVLRYREKRKNRKFEKTIRYASRKAYAETRPRIKGRFAKRTEVETEDVLVDRMFNSGSSGFLAEIAEYGVVPSFL